jgi:hypothetical protein
MNEPVSNYVDLSASRPGQREPAIGCPAFWRAPRCFYLPARKRAWSIEIRSLINANLQPIFKFSSKHPAIAAMMTAAKESVKAMLFGDAGSGRRKSQLTEPADPFHGKAKLTR